MTGKRSGLIKRDYIIVGGHKFMRHQGNITSEHIERENGGKISPRLYVYWGGERLTEPQIEQRVAEGKAAHTKFYMNGSGGAA